MAYNSAYTGAQVDAAVGAVRNKETTWDGKQDALSGTEDQIVGFNSAGIAVAVPIPSSFNYDTIITTQTEFSALVSSETWNEAKNVLLDGKNGEFEGTNIIVPVNVNHIEGINGATIVMDITNGGRPFFGGPYGTSSSMPSLDPAFNCSITGVTVKMTGSDPTTQVHFDSIASCFYGFTGVCDCHASTVYIGSDYNIVSYSSAAGYRECKNIYNCSAIIYTDWLSDPVGFTQCNDLVNVKVESYSDTGLSFSFCKRISVVELNGNGSYAAKGFSGCSEVAYDTVTVDGESYIDSNIYGAENDVKKSVYVRMSAPVSRTVTLSASAWSNNAQTVTVSGILADETKQLIQPMPAMASQMAYYEAGILRTGQAANSLTFTCSTVPTEDLTVYVIIQEVSE